MILLLLLLLLLLVVVATNPTVEKRLQRGIYQSILSRDVKYMMMGVSAKDIRTYERDFRTTYAISRLRVLFF